jgi:general secretion pathway protein J
MRARGFSGFTLIELLVAISVMALVAILSWRGLDGMTRAQSATQQRSDEVLALQAGLQQWASDLNSLAETKLVSALDYDGQVLRMTRFASDDAPRALSPMDSIRVVAWSQRSLDGRPWWLRWQSPPLRTRDDLQTAWAQAQQWARNPGDLQKRFEVPITPADQWQIFYFRADAWTNPLSTAADTSTAANTSAGTSTAGGTPTAATPGTDALTATPDGVRLVLTLPPGQALGGKITRDWVRPVVGGGKS